MTNREAIEALFAIRIDTPKSGEAIERAVFALKFKENYDKFWEEVKAAGKKGKEIEIHHSGRVFRIREVAQ